LDELNRAIAELPEDLNQRPFKKLDGCRRECFERLDAVPDIFPASERCLVLIAPAGVFSAWAVKESRRAR
jgi:hypothetical protein